MGTIRILRAVAGALILSWTAFAQGGPVEFKHVSADAKWLAHVDVDRVALVESGAGVVSGVWQGVF